MTNNTKRSIVTALVIIGITAFISKLVLFFYLMGKAPISPNIVTGEIYKLNNHGYYFYVIKSQSILQDLLFVIFFIFALGGGILEVKWKTRKNLYDISLKNIFKH
jgi:hypothetical protein